MKTHRILIIGVGSIGERHVRCFSRTGRAELSICEVNAQLREQVAERHLVPRAFESPDQALADPPEAAVICTPAQWHVPMAMQLANAGVHLLIEKPLSVSLDGVDRLRELIDQRQLTAGVAYVLRLNPLLAKMQQELHSGRFGRPVQLTAVSGQHFPMFRPAYREIYYTRRATGGGAIQDALTHLINAGQWLLGPVEQVAADAAHQVLEGVDVEDTVHVIARHGPVMAAYSLNQHQAPNETMITVVCDRGTVRCEFHKHRWRWMSLPGQDWTDIRHAPLERDDLFVAQANMFLDALEFQTPLACSLSEGLQTLRTNLAILRAADTHTWQAVSPVG